MEEVELPKHLVVQGVRGLQDPPLDQEIRSAQDLQTVLFPPLILENQVLPWVLVVQEVQSFQACL